MPAGGPVRVPRQPARPGHRGDHHHQVELAAAEGGGVRGRVRAAVDIAVVPDVDRREVAGHRTGRRHGQVQRHLRRALPAEDDPTAVPAAYGADPQVLLGPVPPLDLPQRGELLGDVGPARREEGQGRGHRPEVPRPHQRTLHHVPTRQGGWTPDHVPQPERLEHGRLLPEPLRQQVTLRRERGAHRPGGELAGRDPTAQERAGDRAGGGPDDHVDAARVPADVVLERGEDAGVVGLAHHTACPQHQSHAGHANNPKPRAAERGTGPVRGRTSGAGRDEPRVSAWRAGCPRGARAR